MQRLSFSTSASTLAALLLLFSPAAGLRAAPADESDSAVIARIGDTSVTAGEMRMAIQSLDANTQAAAAKDPAALSQVVRAILTERVVLKEAMAKKWDQDPAVTAALDLLRYRAIVQTYLQSVSRPPDTYPSDAEVQTVYDANKAKLQVPREFDLAQVFIKDPKGADPAADAKAQVKLDAVRKELARHNSDFAAIARASSDEAESAAKGGEIGWLGENKIQPQVRAQLGALTKGSVSDAVRLDDGWHILKVLDVKDAHIATLAEIRPQLVQQMRAQQARVNSQQYVSRLLQQTPIELDELNLSKVLKQ